MNSKKLKYLVLSVLVVIFIYIKAEKGFYKYTGADIDLVRIPLIKPYEIASASRDGTPPWQIMEESLKLNLDKEVKHIRVDSIGIHNNIFIIYSGNMWVSSITTQGWIIYDVSKKKGKCFLANNEYLNYMKEKYDIDYVKLYLPEKLFKDFAIDYTLPPEWNEHIKKEEKERWWDLW